MIILKKRPYPINFSGNAVVYQFYSEAAIYNKDLVFEVKIFFRSLAEGIFKELTSVTLTPYNGFADIDIASILNSNLKLIVPHPTNAFTSAPEQSGLFYIHYREYDIHTAAEEIWITSEVEYQRLVVKGGVHKFMLKGNNYFVNYYPTVKPFLTWQAHNRLVNCNEKIFISWLNITDANILNIKLRARAIYTDKTEETKLISIAVAKNNVVHIQAGAKHLDILKSDRALWYYEIRICDYTVPSAPVDLTELYTFQADYRNDYNNKVIYFFNSLGGFDHVRVKGTIESSVSLSGGDAESIEQYDENAIILPRRDVSLPHRETVRYIGDIGHLTLQEQDRLRDAFLLRNTWMLLHNRWWPVKLLTKEYEFRSTQEFRFKLPIAWTLGDGGSLYYTPEELDLGEGNVLNNVCQATLGNIQQSKFFFAGNTVCEITWSWDINSPAGENITKIQYSIPGYTADWVDFELGINPLKTNHAAGKNFVINFRTVCAQGSYGPVSTVNISTALPVDPGDPPPPPPTGYVKSYISNETSYVTPFTLKVNGVTMATGGLTDYSIFEVNTAKHSSTSVELTLDFFIPFEIYLITSDAEQHIPLISGNTFKWEGINTLSSFTITIK